LHINVVLRQSPVVKRALSDANGQLVYMYSSKTHGSSEADIAQ